MLTAQRAALRYYFADHKARLLDGLLAELDSERTGLSARRQELDGQLADLRERRRPGLTSNGPATGETDSRTSSGRSGRTATRATPAGAASRAFPDSLRRAGLDPVETAEHFAVRRQQIDAARTAVDIDIAEAQNKLTDARVGKQQLDAEAAEVNAELRSLRERKSNIPRRQLDLRALLCRELRLADDTLPFAGELIAVRAEESDWEGAAERLLHSFALVSPRSPTALPRGVRLDRRASPARCASSTTGSRRPGAPRIAPPEPGRGTLAAKLEVKDTVFAAWLERELASRADAECVETMAEFRRATRAVTKAGQVKGGVRHEKDDRYRIDDRSRYVLGWSNERKIDALLGRAAELAASARRGRSRMLAGHEAAVKAAITRGQVLAGLVQTRDFADIDYQSAVNRIAELTKEHARLVAASTELARLDADLGTCGGRSATRTTSARRRATARPDRAVHLRRRSGASAGGPRPSQPRAAAAAHFGAIREPARRGRPAAAGKHAACDRAESNAGRELIVPRGQGR